MKSTLVSLILLPTLVGSAAAEIADFELGDGRHVAFRLSDFADKRLVVVAFIGVDCPLARLYAPRLSELADRNAADVAFVGINSNGRDTRADVARFAKQFGCRYPILMDERHAVADQFGATRQLEVFVLDQDRRVRYHGRVDDQHGAGTRRPAPLRNDLALAIDELLAGQPVSVPETPMTGCLLDRSQPSDHGEITYRRQIAPLLARHCTACHRTGQVAPFALTSYDQVVAWSATIRERVADDVMPPWHADPAYGHFANDRRLPAVDKQMLIDWIDTGMAAGDLSSVKPPVEVAESLPQEFDRWQIGRPDVILTIPQPIDVPAQGVLDYLTVELDPGFATDHWIRGPNYALGSEHWCITARRSSLRQVKAARCPKRPAMVSIWSNTCPARSPRYCRPEWGARFRPVGMSICRSITFPTASRRPTKPVWGSSLPRTCKGRSGPRF